MQHCMHGIIRQDIASCMAIIKSSSISIVTLLKPKALHGAQLAVVMLHGLVTQPQYTAISDQQPHRPP